MTSTGTQRPDGQVETTPRAGRGLRLARVGAGLVLLISLATVAVVVLGDGSSTSAGSRDGTSVGKVVQTYEAGEREPMDDFTAQLLDGSEFDSARLRGRVAVFNVWGSWCGPCRTEAPDLARVATERAADVDFYGINVRDNPSAAQAFERTFEVPYPSIRPEDSAEALLAFRGALASAAVPSTVVVDVDGRIAARVVGPVTYTTLDALVGEVVAPGPVDPGQD